MKNRIELRGVSKNAQLRLECQELAAKVNQELNETNNKLGESKIAEYKKRISHALEISSAQALADKNYAAQELALSFTKAELNKIIAEIEHS